MKSKEKALNEAVGFMYPEITRGPGNERWVRAMKNLAEAFDFPKCEGCCGTGEEDGECCSVCLSIGRVPGSVIG